MDGNAFVIAKVKSGKVGMMLVNTNRVPTEKYKLGAPMTINFGQSIPHLVT